MNQFFIYFSTSALRSAQNINLHSKKRSKNDQNFFFVKNQLFEKKIKI